ncbi:MAG: alpha/beta hydrolase [Candidatus Methylacidiphilales bacterium]|nr:alpha/beta fold hydrolase [Candidatus Methylacidiphilales bacterium]
MSISNISRAGTVPLVDAGILEHKGCALAYKVTGNIQDAEAGKDITTTPVVFIQGTALHGDGWLPQVQAIAPTHPCLTFDNRGMAASQPVGSGAITVEQMAEDTLALMDKLGWESAHLVGHSLGGLIALRLALTIPSRVRSLSLLCTFSRGADATKLTGRMLWLGTRSYIGTRAMRRSAFVQIVMPPDYLAKHDANECAQSLAPLFGHDLADHPPVEMKQLGAMSAYDATAQLGKLSNMPTLVVGARHDPIARPDVVRALAAGIPGSRLVEFEDAAHGVVIQHADRINALLLEHFAKASSRTA